VTPLPPPLSLRWKKQYQVKILHLII